MSAYYFRRSTRKRSFPLGLLCENFELACFLYGDVVLMPYFCRTASSTRISFLRLMGARRFCL